MNNSAKRIAHKTLIENKICSSPNYEYLLQIIESKQFTVILYKKYSNSKYVTELIEKLNLENEIQHNDSFIYINNNLKFVFINADVPYEDKCALLRHELGHIINYNLMSLKSNNSRIKNEEFANEFAYNIKTPGKHIFFLSLIRKKHILITFLIVLVAFIMCFSYVSNHNTNEAIENTSNNISTSTHTDNLYYVTSNGKKYHRDFCITIKNHTNVQAHTLSNAKNKGYQPCSLCIGNNDE